MKKTAISIFTCICMLIGMLSFSIPSYAASSLIYDISNKSFTSSLNYTFSASSGTLTTLYNGTQFKSTSAGGSSGFFYVDLPLTLWQFNGNSSLFTSKPGVVLNFVGFVPQINILSSSGSSVATKTIQVTAVDLISNNGQSCPMHLPSSQSASSCIYDLSGTLASSNGNFSDSFVFRFYVNYTIGFGSTAVGESSYIPPTTVKASFGYKFSSLKIYSYDLQQYNELQKQTDSLENGYDNSSMTDDNTRLNNQIDQYDQAQESATNTSVSNIDAAEFINPSSNTSVFAAMTFSASFLQSLFNNLGDFGIVVMVSLSLCLGLMLVGWFKYRKGG